MGTAAGSSWHSVSAPVRCRPCGPGRRRCRRENPETSTAPPPAEAGRADARGLRWKTRRRSAGSPHRRIYGMNSWWRRLLRVVPHRRRRVVRPEHVRRRATRRATPKKELLLYLRASCTILSVRTANQTSSSLPRLSEILFSGSFSAAAADAH